MTADPMQASEAVAAGARIVLGMTLYNKSEHLREAVDSLLAQTYPDFQLVLLDDASTDATESLAREYERRDARVRYFRHATRHAMVATWREVVDLAVRECPTARYFAWVSDHDWWAPTWLEALVAELDAHPEAVLVYPITQRITPTGQFIDKGPRLFDTAGIADPRARWRRFCEAGVGSGDMVYGLMRLDALRRAGVFRAVLRPDRLLAAEMTLQGEIHQVQKALWFRRMFDDTSISRQRQTLLLPGAAPRSFVLPPWAQHTLLIYQKYIRPRRPSVPIGRRQWIGMTARYLFAYAWRHVRKSEASHVFARAVSRLTIARKVAKHHVHRAVYRTLTGLHVVRSRLRRHVRLAVNDLLVSRHRATKEVRSGMLSIWAVVRRISRRSLHQALLAAHRLGLRGGGETTPR